jgi:hypothetical protein
MATRARLEVGAAVGRRIPTFGEALLRGLVRSPGGVVFGVAVPIVFSTALGQTPVDTGNIAVEGHWSLFDPHARDSRQWTGSFRLLFPAGTRNRFFLMVPGRDRNSGGVEGAVTYRHQSGRLGLHVEAGGGLYVDDLMAVRFGLSMTGALRVVRHVDLVAQLDPWLVLIPHPRTDPGTGARFSSQLAGALGIRLRAGRFGVELAYQRLVPHIPDHHLWVVFDLVLDGP